ncbi:MAG TPA: hypothetical protein VFR07_04595 [Mycobacteriales bacterium]|nr:hypothetical protein [Mycobacteriales bacterium]
MSTHPVIRHLHDLGLAAWTGGSLMGAVGLNGAAASVQDPRERSRVSTAGWNRWAPVNAAAIGAHLVGATGLLINDWPRVRGQKGVAASSVAKTAVTAAGLGVAAWSAALNRKMDGAVPVPVAGATEAAADTPADVAATLRQLKVVQWLNPLAGFAILAVGAWQSEQQRAAQETKGRLQRLAGSVGSGSTTPLALAAGTAALGLLAARRAKASSSSASSDVELVEVGVVEVDVLDLDSALGDSATTGQSVNEPLAGGPVLAQPNSPSDL